MLYVARDGAGDITAICNNPTTAENLRALIDDRIEEWPMKYLFPIGKTPSANMTPHRLFWLILLMLA